MKSMKMKSILSVSVTAVAAIALMTSCGGSKQAVSVAANATEVSVPCAEYASDAQFFRGVGVGTSRDLNTARLKANTTAAAELAAGINQQIKRVVENYVNEMDNAQKQDFGQTFEAMTTNVVNQTVSNTRVVCNKTTQSKDGGYTVYLALEVSKEEFQKSLENGALQDKKISLLFDREKFREKYEEEMANFANSN